MNSILKFLESTGVYQLFGKQTPETIIKYLLMYVIIGALFYLALVKKFEPLLLVSIAFGMLLANLPGALSTNVFHMDFFISPKMTDELAVLFKAVSLDPSKLDIFEKAIAGVEFSPEITKVLEALANSENEDIFKANLELFFDSFEKNPEKAAEFAAWISELNIADPSKLNIVGDGAADKIWLVKLMAENKLVDASQFTIMNNPALSTELAMWFAEAGVDASHLSLVDSVKMTFLHGGLVDYLYLGVKTGVYPSLIFLGIGAMTDFTALIANPKTLLLGAAAQLGVFVAFLGSILLGFDLLESAAIGIIGGADGPTAILVTKTLAPHLLGAIAIAAYSYMALIPIIQPPFMKMLTTKNERVIEMQTLRPVSKIEKVLFPIIVTFVVCMIVPDAAPLVGFLMLGNLFTVCGVTDRLSKTAQNELINIVTIMLGVSVGATANAMNFLALDTVKIILLGLTAFCISTCGGLLGGKVMCIVTKGKVNPLIGSAGVSAVPMAARVSQIEGQKVNPKNFLLMHAMGPNVAGVIGSAVAAGVLLSCFGC